tara:strand:+ start:3914 stop:4189 length:276 start_codon:yes stop_codon:yes gene_type:complete
MERNEYLRELELTLDEIVQDEEIIVIIKETLNGKERSEIFNSFRYGENWGEKSFSKKNSKIGEKQYNKIIKIKKARNLIDYLLLLAQNKNN